jgi:hypothetical protein
VSAYESAGRLIRLATKGMREARGDFDDAMNKGDHRRAQDAANEMATFAIALGRAAQELEVYFNELRGVAR